MKKSIFPLLLLVTSIVFFVLIVTTALGILASSFLIKNGIVSISEDPHANIESALFFMALSSLIIGLIVTFLTGRFSLKPVNRLISSMNRLAAGDYSVRVHVGKPYGKTPVMQDISNSFNKMAEELQNTEMLRSDFINNFSHEFKTPIVSVAGFAKLLKRGNLTEAQKAEYLDIIEAESLRLAQMATNVLRLTEVENQTILTDTQFYNLSEQIRSCILLLEDKWAEKNIEFSLDLGEYTVCANKELLRQVWINLLDNAIKFSESNGLVQLSVEEVSDRLIVRITNNSSPIPKEKQEKIFHKFYQADESHASEGNGIGLSIVKRVLDLHDGTVEVDSDTRRTTFTLSLPKTR